MDKLAAAGFPLATRIVTPPCLIEVYPHPALIELMAAAVRLPYKVGKSRKYWPAASPVERRSRLLAIWSSITTALEQHIGGVLEALPLPEPTASGLILKAFEDKIDAIVCAWVGIEALEGRAMPFGDEDASIWIPVR